MRGIKMTTKEELLEKLRIAKEAKGLSYQDIARITEQNGEAISLPTIQRLFRKGSNVEEFRYHKTIRPIARAVLGMDEELEATSGKPTKEQEEIYLSTIEGLKAVADFKHEQILSLQKEAEYLKNIVDDYKSEVKWHRRLVTMFASLAFLMVAVSIVAILYQ
jgi:transcriptional regulator with XRE-family HTH domain